MTDRLVIIGAGMAGLLAANMLRRHDPVVIEEQRELPNNHSAVLRFRSTVVGDVLGVEFRKVNLVKSTLPWLNPVADALAYSRKNLGTYQSDRSLVLEQRSSERFVAPPDLIQRMAKGLEIKFNQRWQFTEGSPKVLSTIPMPALMKILDYPKPIDFTWVSGTNIHVWLRNCDAFVSLLVPDPDQPFSRISVTGDLMIVECPRQSGPEPDWDMIGIRAAGLLGIRVSDILQISVHKQKYSKISPIDETERKNFIHWASSTKGRAWQLGRFATWRPRLQLDDLVQDVRKIEKWMQSKSAEADMEDHLRRTA